MLPLLLKRLTLMQNKIIKNKLSKTKVHKFQLLKQSVYLCCKKLTINMSEREHVTPLIV